MKFKNIYFTNFFVLLPFLMVFLGEMLQIANKNISSKLKVLSAVYMIGYVFLSKKININLVLSLFIFIPVFVYGIIHSFNIKAGVEDGIRYLFPIVIIFYSFSIRKHYKLLFTSLIVFVIINDFWQIINYVNWIRGETQWFYLVNAKNGFRYYNATSGVIRATGILVFFGLFGFFNALSFFIIYRYYKGKYKNFLLAITLISALLSFSYKIIGPFFIILFIANKNKLKIFLGFVFALIGAVMIIPEKMESVSKNIVLRLNAYIFEGNSARTESYRVMINDFLNFNFFGRGIGSFGGPASTIYHSPVYKDVNFNWFNTPGLVTTDTFFPHLFVELGLVGGMLYLLILTVPLLKRVSLEKATIVFIIYFLLFFDAIFSFSLNNIAYLMTSLVFVYPILEYETAQ